ncbi:MAG: matrixin family metalloprotease [Armatimonadota bacterium]
MHAAKRLAPLILLFSTALASAQGTSVPPPPEWLDSNVRGNLRHGVQLLAAGDFEFAEAHFRSVRPAKPASVYVNVSGAPRDYRRRATEATRSALAAWNQAAPDLVEFVETDEEESADVLIGFEYDVASREGEDVKLVCGTTQRHSPHSQRDLEVRAVIRIAVYPHGVGGHDHKPTSLIHVVGHELGHFFGIGESDDNGDIMGPDEHRGNPATEPSADDVQRLRDLVALSDQLCALAQKKEKIEVPQEWQREAEAEGEGD